jgi:hypothetical protein
MGATAKHARSGSSYRFGRLEQLALGLNGARTRHHYKLVPANLDVTNAHDAVRTGRRLRDEIEARELPVPLGIHARSHSSD